jgi:hypothetical protein
MARGNRAARPGLRGHLAAHWSVLQRAMGVCASAEAPKTAAPTRSDATVDCGAALSSATRDADDGWVGFSPSSFSPLETLPESPSGRPRFFLCNRRDFGEHACRGTHPVRRERNAQRTCIFTDRCSKTIIYCTSMAITAASRCVSEVGRASCGACAARKRRRGRALRRP